MVFVIPHTFDIFAHFCRGGRGDPLVYSRTMPTLWLWDSKFLNGPQCGETMLWTTSPTTCPPMSNVHGQAVDHPNQLSELGYMVNQFSLRREARILFSLSQVWNILLTILVCSFFNLWTSWDTVFQLDWWHFHIRVGDQVFVSSCYAAVVKLYSRPPNHAHVLLTDNHNHHRQYLSSPH